MQVRDAYDLIVIGDQVSGLFLAAGAAEAGMSVLVLEESSVPSVSYEVPSGRLLGDFQAEPVIGLQDGSSLDAFLRSLGLYQQVDELFPLHEPPLQVVGDGFRLDFPYGSDRLGQEVAREFPDVAPALKRLLEGSVLQQGTFNQAVESAGLPVDYENFGWLQAVLYGSLSSPDLSYPAYKEVIQMASRGVRYLQGGRSALKEKLLARMKFFGGSFKRSTAEQIIFEKGKLSGVLLSSYEGFVRSPTVVGAMCARHYLDLVPAEFRNQKVSAAVSRIETRFWRLSFTLLVPENRIPEGMGSHVVLVEDEEPLQLQLFSKDVYSGIPTGHKALVVRSLVPFEPKSLSEHRISRQLKHSLERVRRVIPFLGDAAVFPDPAALSKDLIYQRYYQVPGLDFIPPAFQAYSAALSPAIDQREFADWSRFGLPGLGLCSRDLFPLFGTTGEIFAAMDMLQLLRRRREKKAPGKTPA
jgi:phytoene dehydrogenase-like protein